MRNKIFIMGRITKDPELRTTQNGIPVVSFDVAVDRDYQSGSEKKTDFIHCVAWNKQAEFVNKYFYKGSMIVVEGRLESRKWEDRNGNKRTEWEVQVSNLHFGESKRQQNGEQSHEQSSDSFEEVYDGEGDLPF